MKKRLALLYALIMTSLLSYAQVGEQGTLYYSSQSENHSTLLCVDGFEKTFWLSDTPAKEQIILLDFGKVVRIRRIVYSNDIGERFLQTSYSFSASNSTDRFYPIYVAKKLKHPEKQDFSLNIKTRYLLLHDMEGIWNLDTSWSKAFCAEMLFICENGPCPPDGWKTLPADTVSSPAIGPEKRKPENEPWGLWAAAFLTTLGLLAWTLRTAIKKRHGGLKFEIE